MQKIHLIGNLVRDPETRSTPKGITICSFTVAVDRKFAKDGEKKTDYFRVNAWRMLGDNCARFLSKGKKVAVIGELQPELYESKDGTMRLNLDVQADEVEFLTPKSAGKDTAAPDTGVSSGFTDISSDDIPF